MAAQIITTPNGERLIVLPEAEYEALLDAAEDARDCEAVRRFREALASGEEELIPSEMVDRLLDGENPVRVWRQYRGLSMAELAEAAGVSQPYIAQIEGGKRQGTARSLAKIAKALRVQVDDLLP